LIRSDVKIIGIDDKLKVKIIIMITAGNKKSITEIGSEPETRELPQSLPTIIVHTIGKTIPKISDHGFLINL